MVQGSFHQEVLNRELEKRFAKNNSYSMRSLAKSLDVDPAVVSRVLAGHRSLTQKTALRICSQLELTPKERLQFLESVQEARRHSKSSSPKSKLHQKMIDADCFNIIADIYHYAILELTYVKDFKSDIRWIAQILGLSQTQAKLAINRLLRVGLLSDKGGVYTKTERNITTANKDISTPALRRHQRQILEKAIYSLENDPIADRSMTGMTMAIDPEKLTEAKQLIDECTNKLMMLLETGKQAQVYQLGICLYPLQKRKNKQQGASK